MNPVDEDIGLDDGDEASLLADTGVAGQAVRSLVDGVVAGAVVCHVDAEKCAPVDEPGPAGVVGDALVVEAIEAAAPGLALVVPDKGLDARGQTRELLAGVSETKFARWPTSLVAALTFLVTRIIGRGRARLRGGEGGKGAG